MKKFKRLLPAALFITLLVTGGVMATTRSAVAPVLSPVRAEEKIAILMYHKVNPDASSGGYGLRVLPDSFAWQMDYLRKRGFQTISFAELSNHWETGVPLPPRPLIITFDDGYEDNYTYAYPILKNNGFKATIFLVSGLIGKTNEWDTRLKAQPPDKLLTWNQIWEMEKNGMEFGAHTVTHPILTKITPEHAAAEIILCKQALEKELGHPVISFAYPYGKYNDSVKEAAVKAGYKAAVTTSVDKNPLQPADHYTLKRLRVTGYTSIDGFIRMIEN
jgi:peptidoglycan/xylan/chitin deacetylase (PgdA/CDA1 family)